MPSSERYVLINFTASHLRPLAPGISMDDEANTMDDSAGEEGNMESNKSASHSIS